MEAINGCVICHSFQSGLYCHTLAGVCSKRSHQIPDALGFTQSNWIFVLVVCVRNIYNIFKWQPDTISYIRHCHYHKNCVVHFSTSLKDKYAESL